MLENLKNGMGKLENMAYMFAKKQQIQLDSLIVDDGALVIDRQVHTVELHCGGKKTQLHVSSEDIVNCSITVQHKLIMALMHFIPMDATTTTDVAA